MSQFSTCQAVPVFSRYKKIILVLNLIYDVGGFLIEPVHVLMVSCHTEEAVFSKEPYEAHTCSQLCICVVAAFLNDCSVFTMAACPVHPSSFQTGLYNSNQEGTGGIHFFLSWINFWFISYHWFILIHSTDTGNYWGCQFYVIFLSLCQYYYKQVRKKRSDNL